MTLRHAEVDGLLVLLDLSAETYKVLDDRATAMWSVLVGRADEVSVLQHLMTRYDVDTDRLTEALATFAMHCVEAGLLTKTTNPSDPGSPAPWAMKTSRAIMPRLGRALHCMLGTQRALDRYGFRETYERYARLARSGPPADLDGALSAFARAENLFIARRAPDDCLVRSLSLFRFLKSENIAAEHVLGVKRVPFDAHAWVECGGKPVLDDRVKGFTPLARIGVALA